MTSNFIVEPNFVNCRLDNYVLSKFPSLTRSHIKKLIEANNVLLNGKIKKPGEKLKLGDSVSVSEFENKQLDTEPKNIDIDIVYEDDDVAIINKKQGMVVHPSNGHHDDTLVNALLYHLKNLSAINGVIRPGIVHRLDKDTSGLLIVAKNDKAHISLANQIQKKTCKRHYLALLSGNVKQDEGVIETYIGRNPKDRKQMAVVDENQGKVAITNYFVKKRYGKYTFVEFVLNTGRTHQIRVHSKYLNNPVVGDETYGYKDKNFKLNGQLLHAYKLEFNQPSTNQLISVCCDLPVYFSDVLNKLDRV